MRWKSEGKGDCCTGSEDDNRSVASSNEVGAQTYPGGVGMGVGGRGAGGPEGRGTELQPVMRPN